MGQPLAIDISGGLYQSSSPIIANLECNNCYVKIPQVAGALSPANLFGTPGLLRFKAMRNIVTEGADGIIFMFDAAHPEKDENAIKSFHKFSVAVWVIWLIPYLSPMLFSMAS